MGKQVLVPQDLAEVASPATPPAGILRFYAKADHKPYTKDSTGLEVDLTATGGGGGAVQTKTTTYAALSTDAVVLANAATGAFTVTLPAVAAGLMLRIKKIDSTTNLVTVAPASGTIDGAASVTMGIQWQSRTFVSDGTNWFLV